MKQRAGLVALGAGGVLALEVVAYVWAIRRVVMERLG
jgi:hypothetical protein